MSVKSVRPDDASSPPSGIRAICRCVAAAVFLAAIPAAFAEENVEPQSLVDKATKTIEDFKADPDMVWFRDHLPDAEAVLVVPVLVKGGFILGGSGGHATLLWHDEASNTWGYPAFYFMGSVTFGLQIGGEVAEVVLMIMTDKGKEAFLSTELKLGADVSIAAGPVGGGAKAATTDVLAFSRDKGLFGGLTIEGAVIEPRDQWNNSYYGQTVRPSDILIRRSVQNAGANPLRQAVAGARAAAMPPTGSYDLSVIQKALEAKGYDPGPTDGLMGPKTRDAIRQFQGDNGLQVTGQPTQELQKLLTGTP